MDFEADIDETRHGHYSGPLRKMPNRSDLSLVFRIGFCNVSPEHFFFVKFTRIGFDMFQSF